jgi:hypothetical protein
MQRISVGDRVQPRSVQPERICEVINGKEKFARLDGSCVGRVNKIDGGTAEVEFWLSFAGQYAKHIKNFPVGDLLKQDPTELI